MTKKVNKLKINDKLKISEEVNFGRHHISAHVSNIVHDSINLGDKVEINASSGRINISFNGQTSFELNDSVDILVKNKYVDEKSIVNLGVNDIQILNSMLHFNYFNLNV